MNLDNLIKESRKNFFYHISLAQKSDLFTQYKEIFFRDFDIQSPSFNVDKNDLIKNFADHISLAQKSELFTQHKEKFDFDIQLPSFNVDKKDLSKKFADPISLAHNIDEKIDNSYILKDLDIDNKIFETVKKLTNKEIIIEEKPNFKLKVK